MTSTAVVGVLLTRAVIAVSQDQLQPPASASAGSPEAKPSAGGDSILGGLSLSSQNEPIAVTSDSLEFDYKTRLLTYKGRVVVIQADLKLESDRLRVQLAQEMNPRLSPSKDTNSKDANSKDASGQVREVSAVGNVRLEKGARWATAGRAVFDQGKRTVTLTDKAVLHDGENLVSGDRLTVYLDEERSVVEGGSGRVQAVLFPNGATDKKREAAK